MNLNSPRLSASALQKAKLHLLHFSLCALAPPTGRPQRQSLSAEPQHAFSVLISSPWWLRLSDAGAFGWSAAAVFISGLSDTVDLQWDSQALKQPQLLASDVKVMSGEGFSVLLPVIKTQRRCSPSPGERDLFLWQLRIELPRGSG